MDLPVVPPVAPMLARLSRELPSGAFVYEPKWDGFRCLAFRCGDEVDLRSRHGRPLARYFPELFGALRALPQERFALDGEIVVVGPAGFDFPALMARPHPAASRVRRLATETPASLVAFDLLALGRDDLRPAPFAERRARLGGLLAGVAPPLHLTPATDDADTAAGWLQRFAGGGIDGVVAKHRDLPYQPGARAMVKVKRERTADCVVAGFRAFVDDGRPLVASLLLGLYDEAGVLRHVGVASAFSERRRAELVAELSPLVVPLAGHPWEHGFLVGGGHLGRLAGAAGRWVPGEMALDWIPLAPERVCEVAHDQLDHDRFRHAARFRRWRPDRDARSCTFAQLEPASWDPAEVLAA
jgi:ATP-dependent DNA ligase